MKILVAEDDEVTSLVLKRSLKSLRYEVVVAKDGREAWEVIQQDEFPIVITDWMMPRLDGVDLCKNIRKHQENGYTYIIMLTCKDSRQDRLYALDAGIDDFIAKPLDIAELSARLNAARRVLHFQKQLQTKNRELERLVAAVQESEARFRTLIEVAPLAIVGVDNSGEVNMWNKAAVRMFDWCEDNSPDRELQITDEQRSVFKRLLFDKTKFEAPTGGLELDFKKRDDSLLHLSLWGAPVRNGKDRIVASIGIIADITARKKAENALRQALVENEQLMAAVSSILIGLDNENKVVQWNTTAEQIFGISTDAALGTHFTDCPIRWDWSTIMASIDACRESGKKIRMDDFRYVRTDGRDGSLWLAITLYKTDFSKHPRLLILGLDITERRDLENQLVQAQKLESIGQLAAGIAHEINTPTQYVGDNIRFLQQAFADVLKVLEHYNRLLEKNKQGEAPDEILADVEQAIADADIAYLQEEIPKAIQQSIEGVNRVATIVLAMKNFSHPGTAQRVAADLNQLIQSTTTVARNEWKYVADLVTDFDPDLPPVPCFVGELNQSILNIIINAAHAIAEVTNEDENQKGMITIKTQRIDQWAEIQIRDTGIGIPQEIQNRVFDPFFTTKQVGKGTGQGLAIAHSVIVQKHGGTISFVSEVGKGTTFIIRLPLQLDSDPT